MVNHIQYGKVVATVTGSYDNNQIVNIGGQLMFKADRAEVYIGCEQIRQTLNFAGSANNGGNSDYINKKLAYSGADVFLGFSYKFGKVLEHPMNASYIPMGEEPGFLGRLWNRLFKKKQGGEI
jgi:hypothetical protein